MQEFLRGLAVLLPTAGWGFYVYWAIQSAREKKELDSPTKVVKIGVTAGIAAILFGVVLWVFADFVTTSSESRAENSTTIAKIEELGALVPEFGVSDIMTTADGQVEIDQDAAPASVRDGDQAVEVVPPVVPTRTPAPKRTFDPGTPPVARWTIWFKGNGYDALNPKDKGLVSLKSFPAGMVCTLTNVQATAFAGIESEKWQLQNCHVPNYPDWGSATIDVNGVLAEALGLHESGKQHKVRGTGEWPPNTWKQVKPTAEPSATPSASTSPVGQDMGGTTTSQTSTDTSRFWSRFEAVAEQPCRSSMHDGSAEVTTVTKGMIVMGDPFRMFNAFSTDPRMEVVIPGKGTCWIKAGQAYTLQK